MIAPVNGSMAIEHEAQSRRREVGRKLLSLADKLANTLWLFRRSKEEGEAIAELRTACDDSLRAMSDALDALARFRRSLDETGRPTRPSRLSQPQAAS